MSDYQQLHHISDEIGPIYVLEDNECRILSFGDNDEQSKILKAQPHIPQHTYIQAMLAVLLFSQPKSAIILGLGGGGLIHALRRYDAAIKLTAVELRSPVIDIAKRFFQLPIGKKLNLVHQDGTEFLAEGNHKRVDIIFADMYIEQGVDEKQLTVEFIAHCHQSLKADGFLVLNCWKEHSKSELLKQTLSMHFANVYATLTGGGNWVVYASKQPHSFGSAVNKQHVQQLSKQLDYPVGRALTRFTQWE
ncbi:spermidine synthase [Shewanella sp. UCD-FRSSP16_17]|uniref:spermidine synthase n=1 Tax=Shewanella sp. UCD-FRSSP16_17 TaxID=1853256 RepID=UPI0007EECCE4|nr:fused MFS/spermidine synthase [Shewanella sp. UCD-FRSSP16_17]OBT06911.1 spermidine synthase [Shewanella sp. UCD-FRSSP16_17]